MPRTDNSKEREIWDQLPKLDGIARGRAYFDLSLFAFEKGEHTKSLALAETACECFKEHCEDIGQADSLTTVAFNLRELNRNHEAIRALIQAIIIYRKTSDEQEWEYRVHLAQWFVEYEEKELALLQYKRCLEHYSYQNFQIAESNTSDKVGRLQCALNRCDEAIESFKVSRDIMKRYGDPAMVASIDVEIARCYNHLKDGVSALAYSTKAVSVFDSTNEATKRAEAHGELGVALNNSNDFERALRTFDTAHGFITGLRIPDFHAIYRIQEGKVQALRGLGREKEAEEVERRNAAINEVLQCK